MLEKTVVIVVAAVVVLAVVAAFWVRARRQSRAKAATLAAATHNAASPPVADLTPIEAATPLMPPTEIDPAAPTSPDVSPPPATVRVPLSQAVESEQPAAEVATVAPGDEVAAVEVSPQDVEDRIAGLFVQLARRNQSLLERQIELIDQLESEEQDPDVLDRLFRLDHLAARMRRNAESLLVLGGNDGSRRRAISTDIADVVRVAVGAVEQYTRVRLVGFDEARVHGAPAADLAHLLAELIENATQFSAPESPVDVAGFAVPDGSYVVTVLDRGIGMTEVQIHESNRVLGEAPALASLAPHTLGFAVVSRLAARHHVQVRLSGERSAGVSVVVNVPATALERVVLPYVAPAPAPVVTDEPAPIESEPVDLAAIEPAAIEPAAIEPTLAETAMEPAAFAEPIAAEDPMAEAATAEAATAGPATAGPMAAEPVADSSVPWTVSEVDPLIGRAPQPPPVEPPASRSPLAARPVEPTGPLTPVGYGLSNAGRANTGPSNAGPRAGEAPPLPVRHVHREGPPASTSTPSDSVTATGLTRRVPQSAIEAPRVGPTVAPSTRSPEEVRSVLSRYRSGLREGRGSVAGSAAPSEPSEPSEPTASTPPPTPDSDPSS
jgi:hypothetical protein